MTIVDQLLKKAETLETQARAFRLVAEHFSTTAQNGAVAALPAKIRKAAKLRQAVTPQKKTVDIVAEMFAHTDTISKETMLHELAAHGRKGQAVGNMFRLRYVTSKDGQVMLTKKGRARFNLAPAVKEA